MSRNLRHKSVKTPPKKSVRSRSSTLNNSSDDDYSGVNLISDSEDDAEPDVEKAELRAIMQEQDDSQTPRPTTDDDDDDNDADADVDDDDEESWNGFEEGMLADEGQYFDEQFGRTTESFVSDGDTRRVRFDLSDTETTISNDVEDYDDEYPFPGPFVPQDHLDPSFRRQIEGDADEDRASSDGGYWDYQARYNAPFDEEDDGKGPELSSDSDGSETDESGGYDTDLGETTEEEDPPKQRYVSTRSVLRHPSTEPESSEEETIIRRNDRAPQAGDDSDGPRVGHFVHQPTRPFAILDLKSKRLLMYHAHLTRRHSFDTPRPSTSQTAGGYPFHELSPMISNSANMMMSALYDPDNPAGDFLGGDIFGPPELFFPFVNPFGNGDNSPDEEFDENDTDELLGIDLEDLIDYGSDDEEESAQQLFSEDFATDTEAFSTPRPSAAVDENQPLILTDPHLVCAFQRNQENHRLLSSSNATADSLVFSSPYNHTAIQGIRNGHLDAAAVPITPVRKHKPRPMDPSPLAGQQVKRKFSGEQRGHKRAKSMV